jgi:hypothetical protein
MASLKLQIAAFEIELDVDGTDESEALEYAGDSLRCQMAITQRALENATAIEATYDEVEPAIDNKGDL